MSLISDLSWYFNDFSCIQSCDYAKLVSANKTVSIRKFMGDITFDENITDKQMSDCRKYNKISIKYNKLSKLQRRQCSSLFDNQYLTSYKYLTINGKIITITKSPIFPLIDGKEQPLISNFQQYAFLSLFTSPANQLTIEQFIKLIKDQSIVKIIKQECKEIQHNLEIKWKYLNYE